LVPPPLSFAQFKDRLFQIADMNALRGVAGVHAAKHAPQEIAVVLVAIRL
jgi:hypothetical protein